MSIAAIPASTFVNSIPSVLAAAGTAVGMNGLELDNTGDTSIPIGTVQAFPNQPAVASWYGPSSLQATIATNYFNGFIGAMQIPSELLFFQYNTASVAGYMRGGSLAGMTLSQLQALSGTITVVIDGVSHTSANANLSSATSFTNAAALLQTALQTGTPTTTATVTWDSLRQGFVITSSTTGASSAVGYGTDSSLSPSLKLTSTTGAVLSPGAVAQTPSGAMAQVLTQTQNWAAFTTLVDPDNGAAGGPQKLLFSAWTNSQNGQYAYVGWDLDATPSTETNDSSCYVAQVIAGNYNGTVPLWAPSATAGAQKAAFILGSIASINFNQTAGRVDFAYLSQSGLTPDVSNATTFLNLAGDGESNLGNGYNCYAVAATKSQYFNFLQWGTMPGEWESIDSYINQLYWNATFQNDLMVWRTTVKWVPYTEAGYNSIRQAMQSDINQMGIFGAWVAGVTLSSEQIAEVNSEVGFDIASTLQTAGYYLYVADPGATARASNASPIIFFFYTDGGSVRKLTINSVDVQ
jgi:hypothetical protein